MPRTPARCTQADIQRAIRAMKAENFSGSVLISPNGAIAIVPIANLRLPKPANTQTSPEIKL